MRPHRSVRQAGIVANDAKYLFKADAAILRVHPKTRESVTLEAEIIQKLMMFGGGIKTGSDEHRKALGRLDELIQSDPAGARYDVKLLASVVQESKALLLFIGNMRAEDSRDAEAIKLRRPHWSEMPAKMQDMCAGVFGSMVRAVFADSEPSVGAHWKEAPPHQRQTRA